MAMEWARDDEARVEAGEVGKWGSWRMVSSLNAPAHSFLDPTVAYIVTVTVGAEQRKKKNRDRFGGGGRIEPMPARNFVTYLNIILTFATADRRATKRWPVIQPKF